MHFLLIFCLVPRRDLHPIFHSGLAQQLFRKRVLSPCCLISCSARDALCATSAFHFVGSTYLFRWVCSCSPGSPLEFATFASIGRTIARPDITCSAGTTPPPCWAHMFPSLLSCSSCSMLFSRS